MAKKSVVVYLNAKLVRAAKAAGALQDRSAADQMERWVKFGQMLDGILPPKASAKLAREGMKAKMGPSRIQKPRRKKKPSRRRSR